MKKSILALSFLMITSCGFPFSAADLERFKEACEPHGGIELLYPSTFPTKVHDEAFCVDGSRIKFMYTAEQ